MSGLTKAVAEALEASRDLDKALREAAKLLATCTCQYQRREQAKATLQLVEAATKRWDAANIQMSDEVGRSIQ